MREKHPNPTEPIPIKSSCYDCAVDVKSGKVTITPNENGKLSLEEVKQIGFKLDSNERKL